MAIADIRAILLARERRLDLIEDMTVGRVREQEVEALRKQLVAVFLASVKIIGMRVVSAAITNGPRSSLKCCTSASAAFCS